MILIEAGECSERAFDAKLLLAAQLAGRGHRVVLDERSLPERLDRHQKYDSVRFLAELDPTAISRVVVIGAENLASETAAGLRSTKIGPETRVTAIGRFADRQSAIAARAKIAYATGREPELLDLEEIQGSPLVPGAISPLAAAPAPAGAASNVPQLFLFLPQEALDEPQTLQILGAMDQIPSYRLNLILPGKGKEQIRASRFSGLLVHSYSELPPAGFAALADIAAFFGDRVPGERMAAFALDLMRSGKVVIDCTVGAGFAAAGAPAVRGPEDPMALAAYVEHTVLVNRGEIGRQARQSPWLARRGIEVLERALDLPSNVDESGGNTPSDPRRIFVPTNGVGLGHAQRCTLVASELKQPERCFFAAFPSCLGLILDKGFDCLPLVAKSPHHPEDHANDLLTYLRLHRCARAGDQLIFDGGYVFDSIYRIILEMGLDAVWIRRGLWQAGQSVRAPMERERIFSRVILPGEAFEELNSVPFFDPRKHAVGPVVQHAPAPGKTERTERRRALAERFGVEFNRLVVTMLGGGVAADRSVQMQALAAMMAARPDCLHLIVLWPGAAVPLGVQGWPNTRVVQTKAALALCQIADAVVSAAGYNSFHELLYHGIPTIFVPQMASFMDDQERRAQAAADRGLAEVVLAHELLLLERKVAELLDNGRAEAMGAALAAAVLPERGNALAAQLIELRREGR
ncbi:UDP-N-acetylglucosamine--N-acetylmuramyl-(pentapeptide) pyrophosphoryl-undecaprenol N-acetylglucosamine transferase [Defluviimonas aquaemixtae]|uniref:UDP-N-acetylglucosamine--N-acetylmuramyl-(Pentapeptide) pyrophosphoryl-undecaprenol N-acetylglucosamine transferase n=1 Tax=Albidovulum aquaemixtae TaxID=1542388 RepID=A0A2R8BJ50_9RHOB|nr:glycosyltransferase [Defluviimonas aquaemixtae]SPH23320.1 UDP-N-acetylglucosamine--N-acetylmuramyl-(pentapeptide) pyrophosphoryl-undecaprenol N-acetylglucosamine transferase [Defluviimonas aquaemixtae]